MIKLYIKSRKSLKVLEASDTPVGPLCKMKLEPRMRYVSELLPADQRIKELLDVLAVPYRLIDVSPPLNRLRAWLHGVKQIPTVIVNQNRLTGEDITEANLQQLLEKASSHAGSKS